MPVMGGRIARPAFVVIFGTEGVGKSQFAASAPGAGLVDLHEGTFHLDIPLRHVPSLRPGDKLTWAGALDEIRAALRHPEVRTVVVDGLDDLEPLIFEEVVKDAGKRVPKGKFAPQNIEEVGGGFKAGYETATLWWKDLIDLLKQLNRMGKNVVCTCHAKPATFKNPGGENFQRWSLAIDERAAKLFRHHAEAVIFAERRTSTAGYGREKRVIMDEEHVMHTRRTSGWDAKNRIGLQATMPLSWDHLWSAREKFYKAGKLDPMLERDLVEALAVLPEGPERHHSNGSPLIDYARAHRDEAPVILNYLMQRIAELGLAPVEERLDEDPEPTERTPSEEHDPAPPGTPVAPPAAPPAKAPKTESAPAAAKAPPAGKSKLRPPQPKAKTEEVTA